MSIPIVLVRRLVVTVLIVGLIAAWLGRPGPERHEITVEFARAGLNVRPGDEVRVRGVPVGTIASIDVDRETYTARYTTSTSNPVTVNVAPRVGFGRSGSLFVAKVTSDLGYSGKYVIVQKKNKKRK